MLFVRLFRPALIPVRKACADSGAMNLLAVTAPLNQQVVCATKTSENLDYLVRVHPLAVTCSGKIAGGLRSFASRNSLL
jgi:hypothetical protein